VPLPVVLTSQSRLPVRQACAMSCSSTATPEQDDSSIGQLASGSVSLALAPGPSAAGQP
jgi:hypothetical protein